MRRLKHVRCGALLTLAVALAPLLASAQTVDTLTLSGTFDMEEMQEYGGPVGTDLAGVFATGNAHWWSLTLYGVTYSQDFWYWEWYDEYGYLTYADQQYITRVHATSFDLQFFGFDGGLLNHVVGSQLTRGDLTGGACLELSNGSYFDAYDEWGGGSYARWALGLAPAEPAGVSYFAGGWTWPRFPTDANDFPVATPQRVTSDRTVIRDRRPGNDGALLSYTNVMDIGSAGPFPPRVYIADRSAREGNKGTTRLDLQVTLSWPTDDTVTVNYATSNGTALSKSDYTATSGTLTFPTGETSRTISLPIKGDRKREPDETFTVSLSGAVGATIYYWRATATILNDD